MPFCFELGNAGAGFLLLLLQFMKLHDDGVVLGTWCGLGLPVELNGVFALEFGDQNLDSFLGVFVFPGGKVSPLPQQFLISLFEGFDIVIGLLQPGFRFLKFGLKLTDLDQRGVYRVRRIPDETAPEDEWSMLLAFNGPSAESEVERVERGDLKEQLDEAGIRWVGEEDKISLEGTSARGNHLWRYLLMLALVCLFVEMHILREAKLEERSK